MLYYQHVYRIFCCHWFIFGNIFRNAKIVNLVLQLVLIQSNIKTDLGPLWLHIYSKGQELGHKMCTIGEHNMYMCFI